LYRFNKFIALRISFNIEMNKKFNNGENERKQTGEKIGNHDNIEDFKVNRKINNCKNKYL
jgi:hypothetical protein